MDLKNGCSGCGKLESMWCGDLKVQLFNFRRSWPDSIPSDNPGVFLLHERVVETLKASGISGFIPRIPTMELVGDKQVPIPRYFVLQITGSVEIDPTKIGIEGAVCEICGKYNFEKPLFRTRKQINHVPLMETWTGDDFYKIRNLWGHRAFVTTKIVQMAHENKWTNFVFTSENPRASVLPEHYKKESWLEDFYSRTSK